VNEPGFAGQQPQLGEVELLQLGIYPIFLRVLIRTWPVARESYTVAGAVRDWLPKGIKNLGAGTVDGYRITLSRRSARPSFHASARLLRSSGLSGSMDRAGAASAALSLEVAPLECHASASGEASRSVWRLPLLGGSGTWHVRRITRPS